MDRPTRAYSIGSRNEHNRLFKQHMGGVLSSGTAGGGGNVYTTDMDHPAGRVRAFSVGSKARIPRCDLQRGVLKPNTLLEQKELKDKHCHSNSSSNFNISTDMGLLSSSILSSSSGAGATINSYNLKQLVGGGGGGSHRDKKSTSAPLLLIHKSQNSVDRMSDLMEIDFSIKQQQQQQQKDKQKIITSSTNSRINLNTTTPSSSLSSTTTTIQQPIITTTTTTLFNKTSYNSKSVPTTTQDMPTITTTSVSSMATTNNSNSKYHLSSNNSNRKYNNKITSVSKQQQQQITATDNGYLEMKPVGISQPTTNIKQQKQLKKQRSEQLHLNQTPKTTTSKEQNEGYDVPPEIKSNKQQQQQQQQQNIFMRNINANFTTAITTTTTQILPTTTTITTNSTVLNNKKQKQHNEIELKPDNDNNHNNLEIISLNDENNIIKHKLLTITSNETTLTPDRKYELILDLEEQENKQKKQECQINKNIVNINNEDYANMERKFDAYMKLSCGNENSNNNTTTIATTTTTTGISSNETTLKLYDNEKHVLTHSLSHDEKHNNHQQQQQQKMNRKSCGCSTNINDTSGYEILQIKNSDKMLNQRIFTSVGNLKDNNNKIMLTTTTTTVAATTTTTISISRPRSTNSTLLHSLSSSSSNSSAANVSLSQPVTPTTTTVTPSIISTSSSASILTNSVVNAQISKITPLAPTPPPTSRPSSLNLEAPHALHYARLDWPQEMKEAVSTSGGGGVLLTNETVVLPSCTNVHNVYAKIDFDHSDSSSSSSKNI